MFRQVNTLQNLTLWTVEVNLDLCGRAGPAQVVSGRTSVVGTVIELCVGDDQCPVALNLAMQRALVSGRPSSMNQTMSYLETIVNIGQSAPVLVPGKRGLRKACGTAR